METLSRSLAAALAGYVIGTLPSADIAARLAATDTDLRTSGSGNPGATNVANEVGKSWGAAVMVADIGKGALAGELGRSIAGTAGSHLGATAAVVGHCYPAWNGFRGGKGVATSIGQVLSTFPAYFPIDFAVAAVTMAKSQRMFAANTAASAVWVGASALWWKKSLPNAWAPKATAGLPVAAAVSSAVILRRFLESQPATTAKPTEGSEDQ